MRQTWLFVLLFLALPGCGSTSIYVPVSMPMEIDLRGASTIGVAFYPSVEAPQLPVPFPAAALAQAFAREFSADGRFAIKNLHHLGGVSPGGSHNDESIIQRARSAGVDVLIFGEVLALDYNEDIITAEVRRFQKENGQQIVRKGLLRLSVHLRIMDANTRAILWDEQMNHAVKAETSAADKEPALLDPAPLANDAAARIARDVLALTEKETVSVLATFLTDTDYPGVDAAIRKAQKGDWPDALARFSKLAKEAEGTEDEHKLLYNLGVAYQFNYNFRAAKEAFERAHALDDSQRYLIAIDECLKMEQRYLESLSQE